MNNADIIKALENRLSELCEGCVCEDEDRQTVCAGGCTFYGVKIALSVIKRQKAEIEELRKENFELKDGYFQKRYEETEHQELMGLREAWRKSTDQNMDLQIEIERLQSDLGIWKDIATRETSYVSIAKTEAIKEFAKRLKEQGHIQLPPVGYTIDTSDFVIYPEDIDILLKEMVNYG